MKLVTRLCGRLSTEKNIFVLPRKIEVPVDAQIETESYIRGAVSCQMLANLLKVTSILPTG